MNGGYNDFVRTDCWRILKKEGVVHEKKADYFDNCIAVFYLFCYSIRESSR